MQEGTWPLGGSEWDLDSYFVGVSGTAVKALFVAETSDRHDYMGTMLKIPTTYI